MIPNSAKQSKAKPWLLFTVSIESERMSNRRGKLTQNKTKKIKINPLGNQEETHWSRRDIYVFTISSKKKKIKKTLDWKHYTHDLSNSAKTRDVKMQVETHNQFIHKRDELY